MFPVAEEADEEGWLEFRVDGGQLVRERARLEQHEIEVEEEAREEEIQTDEIEPLQLRNVQLAEELARIKSKAGNCRRKTGCGFHSGSGWTSFSEEKLMLHRQKPDMASATSSKWLPLHTLAVSGEYYIMHALSKHEADINAADKDDWTVLDKAIIGKNQAITDYLLRDSANPFVRDKGVGSLYMYIY
ncbi:putative ankyrin repeat-containing domain-containing protein [Rosa chinensis]|uniref:Putative ankyrin repeat-containing domain-containing protein n=1 Tax=Rosa chinensis TaxID=74649 RepID=A0A2P6S7W0_ROSCH|nr:putative ankyrin repeat-containing domain-containing protein [Rosa chinensis]